MIYIATDHNGFEIKQKITEYFKNNGIIYRDVGPFELCENVLEDKGSKGILICGTGGGMCIAANKVKGIRAAEAESPEEAMLIRQHNDSNVLILSKLDYHLDQINLIIEAWLNTEFTNEERHLRRLKQISDYEDTHDTTLKEITQNGATPGDTNNQL